MEIKPMAILTVLYVWVAIWTGMLCSRSYRPDESNRVSGPIVWGIVWPIALPIMVFALRPPPWRLEDSR